MKAHLINTHLLVPRSGSSAKVNIKYQGHVSQKMGFIGGISVSQTHLVTLYVRVENMGIGENAGYEHFLLFHQCFQKTSYRGSLKVGILW